MTDTPRTISALQTSLFQDGQGTGSISPQDVRDLIATMESRSVVSVKQFGAKADGSTDDSVSIQTAADSGAKVLYFPTGTYYMSASVVPTSNQLWIGDGKGATILTTDAAADGSIIYWPTAAGALLTNFAVMDMTLKNTGTVNNTLGVIYIHNGAVNLLCENVDFLCSHSSQVMNGFRITYEQAGSKHLVFRNCVFDNWGRLTVELFDGVQNGSERASDISFSGCTFTNGQDIVLSFGGYMSGIRISDCHFINSVTTGLELVGVNGATVTGCTWFGSTSYCITCSGQTQFPQNIVISGCNFNMGMAASGTNAAVHLFNTTTTTVVGNMFNVPIAEAAVYVQNSDQCTISSNSFTGTKVAITGNIAIGSATLSNLLYVAPTVSPFFVGMEVIGTGIPDGTTISAIPSATSLTLSANATANATARPFSVQGIANCAVHTFNSNYTVIEGNSMNGSCNSSTSLRSCVGVSLGGDLASVLNNWMYYPNDTSAYLDNGTNTTFIGNVFYSASDSGRTSIGPGGASSLDMTATTSNFAIAAAGAATDVGVNLAPKGAGNVTITRNALKISNGVITAPSFDLFDPLNKSTLALLSNNNLTVTNNDPLVDFQNARCVNGFTSGKKYWEFTVVNGVAGLEDTGCGFADATWAVTNTTAYIGSDTHSYGVWTTGVYYNNAVIFTFNVNEAHTAGIALDIDNLKFWYRDLTTNSGWNNDVLANQNPATNTGGIGVSGLSGSMYPAASGFRQNSSVTLSVVNVGDAPSGFSTLIVSGGSVNIGTASVTIAPKANGPVILLGPLSDLSYNKNVPVNSFAFTIDNTTRTQLLDPAGTLTSGAVVLPASPVDGQEVKLSTTQAITNLTVSGNAGQSIKNAPTTLAAGGALSYIYVSANATWYRTD